MYVGIILIRRVEIVDAVRLIIEIIAGAGFSAPAKLPIQNKIIERMTEVPEMDFLTGKYQRRVLHSLMHI